MGDEKANSIKDLTSETFGLIIAFLLPGVVGVIALSFWSTTAKTVLQSFLSDKANVNLFLLVIIVSLAIGLLLAALRGLIFEGWSPANRRLSANDFAKLGIPEKFVAFRGAVDAHYRYHQCWGGLAVVLPLLYAGWLKDNYAVSDCSGLILPTVCFVAFEAASAWAAWESYGKYVTRARAILS